MVLKFYELKFHKKNFGKFEGYFFKKLEFMELELHSKLGFHKLEFQKDGKLLNILHIVVYCKIFYKIVIFGHFAR